MVGTSPSRGASVNREFRDSFRMGQSAVVTVAFRHATP